MIVSGKSFGNKGHIIVDKLSVVILVARTYAIYLRSRVVLWSLLAMGFAILAVGLVRDPFGNLECWLEH